MDSEKNTRRKETKHYEPNNPLNILTCFYHRQTVPSILTVLELSSSLSVDSVNLERRLDFKAMEKFCQDTVNKDNVSLREVKVKEASEVVKLLREEGNMYDLIMVGIRHQESFELLQGLSVWSENEELGDIGDLLVSTDLKLTASVLAVQQQLSSTDDGLFIA